ncbi:ribosome biogenesis GTPase Der [Patescibacteria group bacterium]|nr:ribosome biogenesis GTPase Der [Patescibacteria group bacterium]
MKQVAIIGRTNVGKSTLFNKLIEQHKALVSNIAGTTRDLNFGVCEWCGKEFEVVDTGGLFETKTQKLARRSDKELLESEGGISFQVEKKARDIIKKADLVLFLVDAKDGILKDDRLIAQLVKKSKKPFILIANKIDNKKLFASEEFKKLGLGKVLGIAATSGVGIGDLLDEVIKKLKSVGTGFKPVQSDKSKTCPYNTKIKVSIIGKPNVGKSSLLNKILGEERVIVSDIPHTTREPQDTILNHKNNTIELVDTAGIRRKSKVKAHTLESAGITMSVKALKKSDIALFTLDISQSLSAQDAQLAGLIIDSGVSVIFVANKYDLLEIDKNTSKELTLYIQKFFPFLTWAPIIFTSAMSGKNTHKILQLILDTKKVRDKEIDPKELNEFVKYLMKKMSPPLQPRKKGSLKKIRAFISKANQKDTNPPVFEINVTNVAKIPESYLRYLENNLRKKFKFDGTPVKIVVERI